MKALVIGIVVYCILGLCYAINFFHDEYENTVENEGMNVGEFFVSTIVTGLLWPLVIIMFAIMNVRDER